MASIPIASSSIPPPSASGSLDLSNLGSTSSGNGFHTTQPSRYGASLNDRGSLKEDECTYLCCEDYDTDPLQADYRPFDRSSERTSVSRSAGFDNANRFDRDHSNDWKRDRDYQQRERERIHDRREPRRQSGYRDRSISPAPRRSYSPGSKDYEDQMTIETVHVGMVIGRGGETLRRIERESGARVQFAPGKEFASSSADDN